MAEGDRKVEYRKGPALIGADEMSHEDKSVFAKAGARAFFIGVVLVTLQAWVTPYVEQFTNGTYLALDHLPKGPIIALFVLILVVNVLLLMHRFRDSVKVAVLCGANAVLIISYAIFFASNGLPDEEVGRWWATHGMIVLGINGLLVCLAWRGFATKAAA